VRSPLSKGEGGVFFVHKNLIFTTVNLNSFCSDYDIEICAVKLLSLLSHICLFSTKTRYYLSFDIVLKQDLLFVELLT